MAQRLPLFLECSCEVLEAGGLASSSWPSVEYVLLLFLGSRFNRAIRELLILSSRLLRTFLSCRITHGVSGGLDVSPFSKQSKLPPADNLSPSIVGRTFQLARSRTVPQFRALTSSSLGMGGSRSIFSYLGLLHLMPSYL